jgi:hypothetical protein
VLALGGCTDGRLGVFSYQPVKKTSERDFSFIQIQLQVIGAFNMHFQMKLMMIVINVQYACS